MIEPLQSIDRLKRDLDRLRPLAPDVLARVNQKLRIDANYHSNAIEGNSLTLGETRSLILHGLTASGKPMRDHLDIEGHDSAVKAIESAVRDTQALTQAFIRGLHAVLLKEPYEMDAVTLDGQRVKRTISLGQYKTVPNNVQTSTGETYFFTSPDQVPQEMTDLLEWYRNREEEGEHPVITAATFHYRFVRIHPFDDGNGRMARLLMNMILMKHGYTVAIVQRDRRNEYIEGLEEADRTESLFAFIAFVASCCEYSLDLHLRAARGESIDDPADIDREIALFKRLLGDASADPLLDYRHLEMMLKSVYSHIVDKSTQFSEVFGYVRTSLTIECATMDGQVVTLCNNVESWPIDLSSQFEPTGVRYVMFNCSTSFRRFQGRNSLVQLAVRNVTSAASSEWEFQMWQPHHKIEYSGINAVEAKGRFNELLRLMMDTLAEAEM